ncbi:MAG: AI-2E family transporter [Ruminococcaceae bacterium]|nr:AI-2E family transporter [Oscillospiraceae bacterium]
MELNRANVSKIMRLIAFTLILYWALQNYAYLGSFLAAAFTIIRPFLFGGILAFVLNVPMRGIERHLLPDKGGKRHRHIQKIRRPLSLVSTILLFLGVIALILILVVPELIRSVTSLAENLPGFFNSLQIWLQDRLQRFPELANEFNTQTIDWPAISNSLANWLRASAGGLLSSTYNWLSVLVRSIYNTFISVVIAIFILAKKETLGRQARNVIRAYLPASWNEKIYYVTHLFSETFSQFLSGQVLDASIMGVLFLIFMLIFGMPYPLLISVLAAVTDLIPMIGPFIGAIVGIFLIMVVSPIKAFWFLIMFLALQQLEQNVIYPRVVGNSVGLPGIWVLVAVTVGGSLYGILGIFLSIPFFSVLYLLMQNSVRNRLNSQNEAADPPST